MISVHILNQVNELLSSNVEKNPVPAKQNRVVSSF
jgi:hypothetical protein